MYLCCICYLNSTNGSVVRLRGLCRVRVFLFNARVLARDGKLVQIHGRMNNERPTHDLSCTRICMSPLPSPAPSVVKTKRTYSTIRSTSSSTTSYRDDIRYDTMNDKKTNRPALCNSLLWNLCERQASTTGDEMLRSRAHNLRSPRARVYRCLPRSYRAVFAFIAMPFSVALPCTVNRLEWSGVPTL